MEQNIPKNVCIVEERHDEDVTSHGELRSNMIRCSTCSPRCICKYSVQYATRNEWPLALKRNKVLMKMDDGVNHSKEYVTVSHVWKPKHRSKLNFMNPKPESACWEIVEYPRGKFISICSAIASRMRTSVAVWIDSVCIDQKNKVEQSEEVSKMGDIYANSQKTFVVLSTKESSDAALRLWKIIDNNCEYRPCQHGGSPKDCKWPTCVQVDFLQTLKILTNDKWFERCWTLQETVLSKNIYVLTEEDVDVDLRKILLYGNGLYQRVLTDIDHLHLEYDRDRLREVEKHNALQLHMYKRSEKGSAHYCLHLLRDRNCEKVEDIIYSVRGLIRCGSNIKVRYTDKKDLYSMSSIMKELVHEAVIDGDFTMLCCLSDYYHTKGIPSYVPVLNKNFLKNIQNTANINPVRPGFVRENMIIVEGHIIGTVCNTKNINWNTKTKIQKQTSELKRYFSLGELSNSIKVGFGIQDLQYDIEARKFSYSREYTDVGRLTETNNMAWNKIVHIKLSRGVNEGVSSTNCLLCNQKVETSAASTLSKCHDGHDFVLEDHLDDTFFVRSAGTPNIGDFVIDIGTRNWQGMPVFIIASYDHKSKAYKRKGMTRSTGAVIGGTLFDNEAEQITFC